MSAPAGTCEIRGMADGGYEVFEFHIGLSNGQLSAAIVLVFLAAILRGFTGFGFSALAVTTLSLFIAPKFVVPVIFILEICASLHLLPGVFKRIDWVLLAKLSFGVVVCTPVGVALLAHLSEDTMRLVLCTLVLALAALLMFGAEQKRPRPLLPVGTGLVAGFANGAAAIGGLPVVLMMLYTGLSAVAARSTLIAFFAFTDVYGLVWVRQNNTCRHYFRSSETTRWWYLC